MAEPESGGRETIQRRDHPLFHQRISRDDWRDTDLQRGRE
nr:MAG TPA_asm: hypothetical protein [Caudoviricetes sp.]